MKVLILGIDGYLGWPLALHLIEKDHEVVGLDNFSRRLRVKESLCDSLTPIMKSEDRTHYLKSIHRNFLFDQLTLGKGELHHLDTVLRTSHPDVIVHLAEQPSAAWSMQNVQQACVTQQENVLGTLELLWAMRENCPSAHLVKLGTMGEYGTPECDIPEGEIPSVCSAYELTECPMQGLQFPRTAGSFYHLSKVHDSANIEFCCRNWGLSSTDIMQGPVFGVDIDAMHSDSKLLTRFDYDECFGTVINRFCVQALVGHPLTIYGSGGQTRGYLPLKDSMECITLAIENPPEAGEYRVFNQFERTYTINELADIVKLACGTPVVISHYENPRKEAEQHYYNPVCRKLLDLGYKPTTDITPEVENLITNLTPFKDRVHPDRIVPCIRWDSSYRRSKIV